MMKADEREQVIVYSKAAALMTRPLPSFPEPRVWTWQCKDGYDLKNSTTHSETVQIWQDFKDLHQRNDPQRDEWDLLYETIPLTTLHFSNVLKLKPPPSQPSPFTNEPEFMLESSLDNEVPLLPNHPQPSDLHIPSDLPLFDQSEEQAWNQLKIVLLTNTVPDITQLHSFDSTISTPEWSHSQVLEDWDKVSKMLGDTDHVVKTHNCTCIRTFVTYMIQNHADVVTL